MFDFNTKRDFESWFRANILPEIRQAYEHKGHIDHVARRTAWNDITDSMHRDGQLPDRALEWSCPF